MQRTILVAAVVVLVALAGAGGTAVADAGAAQDDVVTIELSVSTPGGDAVGGAEATVEWDGGSTTAVTRSNGGVLVDVPAGAELEITLSHDQYVKNGPYVVESATANQVVETTMYEPATAAVTVVDAEGTPVEGATVRLRKDGQGVIAASGTTNAEGVFTSGEVETGTYEVSVRQPGYYHNSTRVTLTGAKETTVAIESGEVTVDLAVQDPTQAAAGPVSANVTISNDGEQVVRVAMNNQGRRSVVLDVNRKFDVTVTKPGYEDLETTLQTGESDTQVTFNVTRTPSISMTAGNEQVVVGENLRVEVTDEYDRPVEGATVFVGGESAGQTGADGVARVTIPSEGEVQVTAEYDGLSAEPVTVTGVPASSGDGGANASEGSEDGDGGDGGTGNGSPGFGVLAALVGALAAVAALTRRD